MTQKTCFSNHKGDTSATPASPDIATLKATLTDLGLLAMNADEWQIVQAITHIVTRRYAHD